MKKYLVKDIPDQLKYFYKLDKIKFYTNQKYYSGCSYGNFDMMFNPHKTYVYLDISLCNDLILPKYNEMNIVDLMKNFLK